LAQAPHIYSQYQFSSIPLVLPIERLQGWAMATGLSGLAGGFGLNVATRLVQWNLGVGLALLSVRTLAQTNSGFRKWLGSAPWEVTFKTASAASGPALTLAAFALVQARGGVSDILSKVGLVLASACVVLDTLLVLVTPLLGGKITSMERLVGGLDTSKAFEEGDTSASLIGGLSRAASIFTSLGQGILVFAAAPGTNTLLICASATLRTQLAVNAFAAVLSALKLYTGSAASACAYTAEAMQIAPALAVLALLDLDAVEGEMGLMATPALWCSVAVVLQASGAIFRGLVSRGTEEELEEPQRAASLPKLFGTVVAVALAGAVVHLLIGTISFRASLRGVTMEWGEPMAAGAAVLISAYSVIYCAKLLSQAFGEGDESAIKESAVNGMEVHGGVNGTAVNGSSAEETLEEPAASAPVVIAKESAGLMAPMVGIASNLPGFALALLASRASEPAESEEDPLAALATSLRYGLLLLVVGVKLQAALALLICAGQSEPDFDVDCGGVAGSSAQKVLGPLSLLVQMVVQVGLVLGLAGLGMLFWPAFWVVGTVVLYPFMPAMLKQALRTGVSDFFAGCSVMAEVAAGSLGAQMEAHQKQRMESQTQQAAQKAAALLEEDGGKGKAGKGSEFKTSTQKAAKAKSAPKSGPKPVEKKKKR